MISGYVDTAGKYTGAEEQKTQLQQYAASCGLPLERIICGQGWEEDKLSLVKRGDSLLVADVSVFGQRYEDILNNVRQAAMRGLRLYTVRERLHLDLLLPQPLPTARIYVCSCIKVFCQSATKMCKTVCSATEKSAGARLTG